MIVRIGVPLSLQDTIMQSDLECICVYAVAYRCRPLFSHCTRVLICEVYASYDIIIWTLHNY